MEQIERYRKIRKTWGINPKERVKDSKKKYDRQKEKRELDYELYRFSLEKEY